MPNASTTDRQSRDEGIARHKAIEVKRRYLRECEDGERWAVRVVGDPLADPLDVQLADLALDREHDEANAEALAAEVWLDYFEAPVRVVCHRNVCHRNGRGRQSRRARRSARRAAKKALGDPDGEPAPRAPSAAASGGAP